MLQRRWGEERLALVERCRMSDAELASFLESLIRAERTGARSLTPLLERTFPPIRTRLVHLQRVASRNIAALGCLLRRFGREAAPSNAAALPEASLTRRSLRARLELAKRGQAWAARRIEGALPRIGQRSVRQALDAVRDSHLLNIGICRGILVDLDANLSPTTPWERST
jgi:hypothetical protein